MVLYTSNFRVFCANFKIFNFVLPAIRFRSPGENLFAADAPPVPVALCRSVLNEFVIMLQQFMLIRQAFRAFAPG